MSSPPWAPDSSPPSSPNTYGDSSPPASPRIDPDCLVSLPAGQFDLYAASAKPWIPPDSEKGVKRAKRLNDSPSRERQEKKRRTEDYLEDTVEMMPFTPTPTPRQSTVRAEDAEAAIWDKAASDLIDSGNGSILLDGCNLTSIPMRFIDDLGAFFAPLYVPPPPPNPVLLLGSTRTFSRVKTAPAVLGPGSSRISGEIALFLGVNHINILPKELFQVEKLTVLSLRSNCLTVLHPDIRFLVNLHTLNIANNQLSYLPAEIAQLRLQNLNVFPNPFLSTDSMTVIPHGTGFVSRTQRLLPRVTPLVELCLRILFTSDLPGANTVNDIHSRRLAKYYELPILENGEATKSPPPGRKRFTQVMPISLRRILDGIHPNSVFDWDGNLSAEHDIELGVCSSSKHPHSRPSVFVRPAEERFSWEKTVAGVDLGDVVPLRWQGCNSGCLSYLGPEEEHAEEAEEDELRVVPGDLHLDFDDET